MKVREKLKNLVGEHYRSLTASENIDPTEYADPLFGVGSATSAGPTMPAGSIHPSPETLEADCGGYLRNQPIVGFGQAYTSGAGGIKCYGNFLLCPMTSLEFDREKRASFARSHTEIARCYEYRVTLENGISVKVTPAHNSAIYELAFPEDSDAYLFFDIAHKLDLDACMKRGAVTVDPKTKTLRGGGLCSGNWNSVDWNMFFSMALDTDFCEVGALLGNDTIVADSDKPFNASIDELKRFGIYLKFPRGAVVRVKLAISFVSIEKAKAFLYEQIPAFDYDAVREAVREAWRRTLGVIELETEDSALLRRFYTAMYHMNIQPRDRTSDHGTWDDFHTVWDTWKTVFPMYSLLYPQKMASIVDSFIDRYHKNKAENNGIVVGDEYLSGIESLPGQGGNDIDNAISDAYLKGVKLSRHDWEEAYALLCDSAENMRTAEYCERGYASSNGTTVSGRKYTWRYKPAAATMGFAFNDRAVAAVAKELGTREQYEKYEKRSKNWLNVWNAANESEGFYGFPQIRNDDGTFDTGYDAHGGYNSHYYEATGWDASYFNYNDVSGLVEAMGGTETFIDRLLYACEHSINYFNDDHGAEGYLNFTNEPSFHIPWLFCTDEIRRPDLAAKVIDSVIKRFALENDYPGDEDNGGMSSYYVFLMSGFFPFATTENYYLHGTRLKKITFRLGNGRELVVTGDNVGKGNIYVQSAAWNGKPLNVCKLTHAQIYEGGELHFVMGSEPSNWAFGCS